MLSTLIFYLLHCRRLRGRCRSCCSEVPPTRASQAAAAATAPCRNPSLSGDPLASCLVSRVRLSVTCFISLAAMQCCPQADRGVCLHGVRAGQGLWAGQPEDQDQLPHQPGPRHGEVGGGALHSIHYTPHDVPRPSYTEPKLGLARSSSLRAASTNNWKHLFPSLTRTPSPQHAEDQGMHWLGGV